MGGENSMVGWVDSSPPLANKDYTHVNSRGARKMAELLFTYLMGEYAHPVAAPAAVPSPTPQRADSAAKAVAPADSTTR
jgi:hypothetical protein